MAVRVHKTLETARDKFYMITCGKAGFQNARNETSLVSLELTDAGHDGGGDGGEEEDNEVERLDQVSQ